jgi:hypothetical protein
MPAHDECRNDGLIATGRSAEEINDRELLLHRILEPTVIGCGSVVPHELVVDDIVTRIDLLVGFALIGIPDPSAFPREYGLDAQQVCHLPRPENPAPRID